MAQRTIGLPLATALVASNIVGSGIFLLPAAMAALGSSSLLGWLVATAGALLLAGVFARLSRRAPVPGGPCAWPGVAFGRFAGFESTCAYWLSCWTGDVAIALAAVGYFSAFWPRLAQPLPSALAAIALIWIFTGVNLWGPRLVCQLEAVAMVAGLAPILWVCLAGWIAFRPGILLAGWRTPGATQHLAWLHVLPLGAVLAFWAFTGLESAAVASAIVEHPERNVPRATWFGTLIAAGVYAASCTVVMGILPTAQLARSSAPFADAMRVAFGPTAAMLVALGACIKVTGSLAGWLLVTAQNTQAGAERRVFPAFFAHRAQNLWLMAAVMTVLVFASMAPTLAQQFAQLIEASTLLCLLVYVLACCAALRFSAQSPAAWPGLRWRATAAGLICVAILATSGARLLLISGLLMLLALPLYARIRHPIGDDEGPPAGPGAAGTSVQSGRTYRRLPNLDG